MRSLYVSLLLASCILGCIALPYGKNSPVISLTKDNFAEQVFGSEHVWIVEFYAPWCGHCKNLAPEYEKLAQNFQGIIKVAAINCDEHKELAGYFGVQGFPTIKIFPSKIQKTKDGKGFEKIPEDYQGQRTAAAMANYALAKLPSFVTDVTSKSVEKFLDSEKELAKVLLFTDKDKTSNLYKALSVDFHYTLSLGEVRKTETALVQQYGVTKYPTLIVLTTEGKQLTYDGKLEHAALFKFLKPFAKEHPEAKPQGQQAKPEKTAEPTPPPEFVYDVRTEVADQSTFDSICATKLCIVVFLDPTNTEAAEQKGYLDLLQKLQDKHKKLLNFIWMDGLKQVDFTETFYLRSGFPAAVLFNQKKKVAVPYIGSFNEENVGDFVDRISIGGVRGAIKFETAPKVFSDTNKNAKEEL